MSVRRAASEDATTSVHTPSRMVSKTQTAQKTLADFWSSFNSKYPGKPHQVLPRKGAGPRAASDVKYAEQVAKSYEEAKLECVKAVDRIAKECTRMNQRYTDAHFDIELDLKLGRLDCLNNINAESDFVPKSVKRIPVRLSGSESVSRFKTGCRMVLSASFNRISSTNPDSTLTRPLQATFGRDTMVIVGSWLPLLRLEICPGCWGVFALHEMKALVSTASSSTEVRMISCLTVLPFIT